MGGLARQLWYGDGHYRMPETVEGGPGLRQQPRGGTTGNVAPCPRGCYVPTSFVNPAKETHDGSPSADMGKSRDRQG